VGEDEEIEILLRRWALAKRGDGCVVLISGEPGIGKFRIARAIVDRLRSEPHTLPRCFTEGLDTVDLKEAKFLLDRLL
jgi:predicted ATPase